MSTTALIQSRTTQLPDADHFRTEINSMLQTAPCLLFPYVIAIAVDYASLIMRAITTVVASMITQRDPLNFSAQVDADLKVAPLSSLCLGEVDNFRVVLQCNQSLLFRSEHLCGPLCIGSCNEVDILFWLSTFCIPRVISSQLFHHNYHT